MVTAQTILGLLLSYHADQLPQAEKDSWQTRFANIPQAERDFVNRISPEELMLLCCSPETAEDGSCYYQREDGVIVAIPPGLNKFVQDAFDVLCDGTKEVSPGA